VTNGTVTAGQGTSSATIQWGVAGAASVTLIESKGLCADTSVLNLWVGTVGIAAVSEKKSVTLSPNPVKDKAVFSFPEAKVTTIKIMDMLGNEVSMLRTEAKSNLIFSTSGLNSGVYFYQVISDSKSISTGKLIVE
ncbi:MAG TPA: T9SS type A sorting domain-containing protein, partial [Bacteroidia bacterium]|nr:T9SS type A sorting domain-containing protein [Bacteroidia bacterium]